MPSQLTKEQQREANVLTVTCLAVLSPLLLAFIVLMVLNLRSSHDHAQDIQDEFDRQTPRATSGGGASGDSGDSGGRLGQRNDQGECECSPCPESLTHTQSQDAP